MNMNNNNNKENSSFLKGKGAAAATVICFIAVIAMVGAFTFNRYQDKLERQMAEAVEEAEKQAEEDAEAAADNILLPESETDTSDTEDNGLLPAEDGSTGDGTEMDGQQAEGTAAGAADVWFSEDSILDWPASGAVIMNYSMDQTIYFSTLDQYKYNPALVIAGKVGENIGAAAPGVVTSVEQDAQTGLTVTLDMGNGYSAVYGQLKEVPVAVGDYVAKGQIVGYLSEPTKYYTLEGPNLYFKVTKDGEPVNPMDFMEG